MTHKLEVFQSSWAMFQRRPDGFEWSLEERFKKVSEAGYAGLSIDMGSGDHPSVEQAKPLFAEYGLASMLVAFLTTVESLKPVMVSLSDRQYTEVLLSALTARIS